MKGKTEVLLQKLEQGVKDVFTSENFINYLKISAKFHNYSYNNIILILKQKPEASMIAGFKKWNETGRVVKKGEKGISILAPNFKKKYEPKLDQNNCPVKDSKGKEVTVDKGKDLIGFFPTHVFDASQTDGDPMPELASHFGGEMQNFNLVWDALCECSPYPADIVETLDVNSVKGVCVHTKKQIHVAQGLSQEEAIATLIHEIAHARTYNPDPEQRTSKNMREIEAESCAYVVSSYFGIDPGISSFEYIASWCENKDVSELKKTLSNINKEANIIISHVTDYLNKRQPEKIYDYSR